MTRTILTINFNDALCDNARRSMQASARRWGCDFLEINPSNDWCLPMAPQSYKTAAFARTDYDEVFILDADVIVSSRCPNPFETFPCASGVAPEDPNSSAGGTRGSTPLIAVANGSARFGDLAQIKSAEAYEVAKLLAQEPRLRPNGLAVQGADPAHPHRFSHASGYHPSTYFNTGMLLARRSAHEAMFALAHAVCHVDHGLGWCDQTPINLAALFCKLPVQLVDERWNYIHGCTLGPGWMDMTSKDVFIMHFAGETGREHTMPKVRWE